MKINIQIKDENSRPKQPRLERGGGGGSWLMSEAGRYSPVFMTAGESWLSVFIERLLNNNDDLTDKFRQHEGACKSSPYLNITRRALSNTSFPERHKKKFPHLCVPLRSLC